MTDDKEIQMPKPEEPAEELHVVGLTYDRIVKWLLANQPAKAEETSEAEGETKDD